MIVVQAELNIIGHAAICLFALLLHAAVSVSDTSWPALDSRTLPAVLKEFWQSQEMAQSLALHLTENGNEQERGCPGGHRRNDFPRALRLHLRYTFNSPVVAELKTARVYFEAVLEHGKCAFGVYECVLCDFCIMSAVENLSQEDQDFLAYYLPGHDNNLSTHGPTSFDSSAPRATVLDKDLPFVTLTYACSLDGMIALAPGLRTTLSGPETKCMTHYLRRRHDAILIGVNTAIVDDPGLNCRYPNSTLENQPRPVIVDPTGRWDHTDKKVCKLASEGSGKAPWVITRNDTASSKMLHEAGGEVLIVQETDSGQSSSDVQGDSIPWRAILKTLKDRGINSVMIEGGATVLKTLLTTPQLVDSVIMTIAPTWLGQGGVAVSPSTKSRNNESVNAAWLRYTTWRQFGSDAVLCGKLQRS